MRDQQAAHVERTVPIGRVLIQLLIDTSALMLLGLLWTITLAGATVSARWPVDLLVHWRPHYLLGFMLLSAFWLRRRRPLWWVLAFGGMVWQLSAVGPYLRPAPMADSAGDGFSVVSFNTFVHNPTPERVNAYLASVDADLVALLEATPQMAAAVAATAAAYPYRFDASRHGTRGFLVFSRLPLTFVAQRDDGGWAQFQLLLDDRPVDLFVVHTRSPLSGEAVAVRNWQLGELARAAAAAIHPVLLVGDLNSSPWSRPFANLLAVGGLQDGRRGHALAPTWPSAAGPFGTPIDHVLVSPTLQVRAFGTGPGAGSDHRPVAATIRLSVPAQAAAARSGPGVVR